MIFLWHNCWCYIFSNSKLLQKIDDREKKSRHTVKNNSLTLIDWSFKKNQNLFNFWIWSDSQYQKCRRMISSFITTISFFKHVIMSLFLRKYPVIIFFTKNRFIIEKRYHCREKYVLWYRWKKYLVRKILSDKKNSVYIRKLFILLNEYSLK